MEPSQHADPLEEALSHGSQRVAQLASLAAAAAQVVMQRRALSGARQATRDDEHGARILREQERLLDQEARLSWAPVHDPDWLAHADLAQAGRAWAAAASHADAEPAAASAMRKCEDRLRKLHPYAMARYDRLRDDGMDPLDAMREAAPMFARSPTVRVGEPAPTWPALTAGAGDDASLPPDVAPGDPGEPTPGGSPQELAEARGQQIAERLQAGAIAAGRPPLEPDELAVIMEATTNLPEEVIAKLARRASGAGQARPAGHTAATYLAMAAAPVDRSPNPELDAPGAGPADAGSAPETADRSPAALAADSFPHSAADAVRAATATRTSRAVHNPSPVSTATTADLASRPAPPL